MSNSNLDARVSYARRVHDHTLEWYRNADTKAQVILTLDGAFLTFITGSVFINRDDLTDILGEFTVFTWLLLALMSLTLTLSIIFSIVCLWSRISLLRSYGKTKYLREKQIEPDKLETYKPDATWFFQYISWLDREHYQEYLMTADKEFEVKALATNIHALSKNVLEKHQWVNWGFILAGASLILFFAMGISYIIAVA